MRRFLGFVLKSLNVPNDWFSPGAVSNTTLTHIARIRDAERDARLVSMGSNKRRRRGEPVMITTANGFVGTNEELDALANGVPNPALYSDYIFQCAYDQYNLLMSRAIGTAVTDAAPGEKFDIRMSFFAR